MTPAEQKAFSSWWLDEKYGGDFVNVPGLTQNPNGNWVGEAGRIYDINPETGQKGQYQWMGTSAVSGWLDVTKPLYYTISNPDGSTYEVEMIRNRHGLYAPDKFLTEGGDRIRFNTNPNTGEEGEWIWLGTMGWTNTKGDPQEPLPEGTPTFGDFGDGSIVGPAGSEVDATSEGAETTETTSGMFDTDTSSAATSTALMQGSYSPSTPMQIGYKAQPLSSLSAPSGVDYTKLINSAFTLDVLEGMMTGRKV